MEKKIKLLYLIKAIILTILFSASLYFENAQQQRLFLLCIIFIIYLVIGLLRCFIKRESNLYFISFIIDTAAVYILEYNSRLLINYFFHSFYIIILLEAAISLNMKKGVIIGSIVVFVSMIKYVYLIYYKFNLSSVSQVAFFLMANALILITAGFAQYNNEEREKKDVLYRELLDAHRKLKEYNAEVNRLLVVEEKNKIARDIHDSLGHSMTALIMQLQMAEHYFNNDNTKSQALLVNSIETAKNSLSGIRDVVETLRGDDSSIYTKETMRRLIDEFSKNTGAVIKLNITGETDVHNKSANANLYRIIQEAMTNSVRHGRASTVCVNIDYTNESIYFTVKDNGVGASILKEGYGLKGIKERVEAYNGKVEFTSTDGFNINGVLSLEEKNDKSTVS